MMDWTQVPAYLRPEHARDDPGLLMPYRWSRRVRDLWMQYIEMGLP